MDFFAHQIQARKQTRRLLILFLIAVAALIAATNAIVLMGFPVPSEQRPAVVLVISTIIAGVIAVASLYRIGSLRSGGSVVALQLGAVPVPAGTGNPTYQRLRNIVEEVAIASGVTMPEVFVLEEEAGINAFAAGYATTDAAITVTRGALDSLTRAELQGVIAHEFSHVLNGDMRLNIRLMGVLFGLIVLSSIGRHILAGDLRRGRRAAGIGLAGLVLLALGWTGVLCARLIKASVSRQREFLADASAVQFTRDPGGLAGALKKIAALPAGSQLQAADREEVAHMLFGDGLGRSSLFATHPPLLKRIRRLQPRFDPSELARIANTWRTATRSLDAASENASISGFVPQHLLPMASAASSVELPAANTAWRLQPDRVARMVGNPGIDDHRVASTISRSIPERLRQAAQQQETAMQLILALALGGDPTARDAGLRRLAAHADGSTLQLIDAWAEAIHTLHPLQHLPLATLAFPALRRRPRAELATLMEQLNDLIHADGVVELFEYCLVTLIRSQVVEALDPAAHARIGRTRLVDCSADLANLYAIVASKGHADDESALRAFRLGIDEALPMATLPYAPPENWIAALDQALPRLDRLAPAGKELVVAGLVRAIASDGVVDVAESELLRVICACLHCPLPPLLQQ